MFCLQRKRSRRERLPEGYSLGCVRRRRWSTQVREADRRHMLQVSCFCVPLLSVLRLTPFIHRCGSRRHNLSKCREAVDPENPLPFSSCFVCSKQGHLASQCPENRSKGVYPNGGCCKLCQQTTHLAKDCPMRKPGTCHNNPRSFGHSRLCPTCLYRSYCYHDSRWNWRRGRGRRRRFPHLPTQKFRTHQGGEGGRENEEATGSESRCALRGREGFRSPHPKVAESGDILGWYLGCVFDVIILLLYQSASRYPVFLSLWFN